MGKKKKDKSDKDNSYLVKGVITMRALRHTADSLESYIDLYEVVNNDPAVTFRERKESIEIVKKAIESFREGKLKYMDFDPEDLSKADIASITMLEEKALAKENGSGYRFQ